MFVKESVPYGFKDVQFDLSTDARGHKAVAEQDLDVSINKHVSLMWFLGWILCLLLAAKYSGRHFFVGNSTRLCSLLRSQLLVVGLLCRVTFQEPTDVISPSLFSSCSYRTLQYDLYT